MPESISLQCKARGSRLPPALRVSPTSVQSGMQHKTASAGKPGCAQGCFGRFLLCFVVEKVFSQWKVVSQPRMRWSTSSRKSTLMGDGLVLQLWLTYVHSLGLALTLWVVKTSSKSANCLHRGLLYIKVSVLLETVHPFHRLMSLRLIKKINLRIRKGCCFLLLVVLVSFVCFCLLFWKMCFSFQCVSHFGLSQPIYWDTVVFCLFKTMFSGSCILYLL